MRFIRFVFLFVFLTNHSYSQNHFEFNVSDTEINEVCELIIENLDTIRTEYQKIEALQDYPFQTASLFTLSNVMLNHWQLKIIGDKFFENSKNVEFTFDSNNFYTNQLTRLGKYNYGLYGNQLNNINFITIDSGELKNIFSIEITESVIKTKEYLLDELFTYFKEEEYKLSQNKIDGFNELGLMQREIISILVLTEKDDELLTQLASIISKNLIKFLNDNKSKISLSYGSSHNHKNISFHEYFYLWYQSLIREVTDRLINLGFIKTPFAGNFNYVVLINK